MNHPGTERLSSITKQVCDYIGWGEEEKAKVEKWILENRMAKHILIALDVEYPPYLLRKMIEENKTIRYR